MENRGGERVLFCVLTVMLAGIFVAWLYVLVAPALSYADINSTAVLNTTVNITNSAPEVREVVIPPTIDLEPYGNKSVSCNVTVYDYDNNTGGVNATLYYYLNSSTDPDDMNTHYTNKTCSPVTPANFAMNFTCTFDVAYFANDGTWYCNATAWDTKGVTGTNISDAGTVNPLVALYVPGVLDFGELQKGDTSDSKTANITNAGNRRINVSVEGWGVTQNDGLAMGCTYGEIPLTYEKYNVTNEAYANMYTLTGVPTKIFGLYVEQRTSESQESMNQTYWRLQIPGGAGGICNGKILFTASEYFG